MPDAQHAIHQRSFPIIESGNTSKCYEDDECGGGVPQSNNEESLLARELAQDTKFANITSGSNDASGSKERAILQRKRQSVSQNMFHRNRPENPAPNK